MPEPIETIGGVDLSLKVVLARTPSVSAEDWGRLSAGIRWLVMVRAVVLIMTIIACATGGLLAWRDGFFEFDLALCLLVGLLLAHAANNLLNDWVDHQQGVDKGNYFRRKYGVQVLEDGLISPAAYMFVTGLTGLGAVFCGGYLVMMTDLTTLWLMAIGAFFVLFYTWPLKHYALGELAVFLVWGPLMVCGTYYVLAGTVSHSVWLVSVLAGLGPTLVIMGKHIDKIADDSERNIKSLPVLLGETHSRLLAQFLIIALGLLTLISTYAVSYWIFLCVLSTPAAVACFRSFGKQRPDAQPVSYPSDIWPLWFVAFAFRLNRDHGLLVILALTLACITGY